MTVYALQKLIRDVNRRVGLMTFPAAVAA